MRWLPTLLLLSLAADLQAQDPCGMQRLEAWPATSSGHFGSAVALSDSWLAVGAAGTPRGSISLYERWSGQFVRRFTGNGVVAFDGFPGGLAIDDQLAVAGAYGLAYVFDVNSGAELLQLAPTVPIPSASFGAAVAMDATRIAVGAPGPFHMPSGINGTVYVFDRVSGQELLAWQPQDLNGGWFLETGFGVSVALEDGLLIGGALDDGAGTVHVFDLATGLRRYRLTPNAGGVEFGSVLAAGGGRLAVVDRAVNFYAGRVSVYDLSSGQWLYDVVSPDLVSSDGFGSSVALDGDLLVVGAAYHSHPTGGTGGAVYVFDASSGAFRYELLGTGNSASRRFGRTVALRDGVVAVGDPEDSKLATYAGAAYQFSIPVTVGATACASAVANSSGQFGQLEAYGCTLYDYELSLRASLLPPNQLGLFLASAQTGFSPMHQGGQGTLCLGAPIGIYRSQAASSGAGGVLELLLDLTHIPTTPFSAVAPGDTWYFQAWHRDWNPAPTSNLTATVAVQFR